MADTTPAGRITSDPKPEEFSSPAIVHYENGPITTRMVERDGCLWSVTYEAQHDGYGWRVCHTSVNRVEREPGGLRAGDLVEIRCKIEEDAGPDIKLRVECDGYRQLFWAKRSAIVRVPRPSP